MSKQLGYACICLSLPEARTNRKMIKKTFTEHGIVYASKLALLNATDLKKIIEWNYKMDIKVFRYSSSMFPWMSNYELKDLPDYKEIKSQLKEAGLLAKSYGQRLTNHPGPFNQLASVNSYVVKKSIKELNQHGEIMDMINPNASVYNKINIHVGCQTGGKEAAAKRFCENFKKLNESTRKRLVVENDDKPNLFTTRDLYNMIHKEIGIPITFDFHHHWCNPGEDPLTEEESLKLAATTWPDGVKQCTHYSSAKRVYEDESAKIVKHADYIYDKINDHGLDIDVVIEAKAKELALIKYRNNFETVLY